MRARAFIGAIAAWSVAVLAVAVLSFAWIVEVRFFVTADNTYYVNFVEHPKKKGSNRWEVLFEPEGRNLLLKP
jgi:hypothetical protein